MGSHACSIQTITASMTRSFSHHPHSLFEAQPFSKTPSPMSTKPNSSSCRGCGEDMRPWTAPDSEYGTYAGWYCHACGDHRITVAPSLITLRTWWQIYGGDVTAGSALLCALLLVCAALFPLTEGRVEYCYVRAPPGIERVPPRYCLYGHEDWRTDRVFTCDFTTPEAALVAAAQMRCPMEVDTKP